MEKMKDLIERQAAIEAAIKATDDWDGGYNITRANMIEKELNDLPSAQPEQRWIPVTERLPKEYGNYLISIHGEDEPDIGTINPNDKRGWSLCDANGFYWASDKKLIVTAWMPLPEPYRAERRTDNANVDT